MRLLRLSVVEAMVLAVIVCWLGWIFFDATRIDWATQRGIAEATADLSGGNVVYRLRGRPRLWEKAAMNIAAEKYGIRMVRTGGCACSGSTSSCDFAYNRTVEEALNARLGFNPIEKSFDEARVAWRDAR